MLAHFQDSLRSGMSHFRQRFRFHLLPLAIVTVCIIIGQVATLTQHPLIWQEFDAGTYISAAHLLISQHMIDSFRTPMFPLVIATVISLGAYLKGVVLVLTMFLVAAIYEIYLLFFRLSHRRMVATIVASLLALNLYFLSWERVIYTEAMTAWAVVTVFLIFERFIRKPSYVLAIILGIFLLIAILIRPDAGYLAVLFLVITLAKGIATKDFGTYLKTGLTTTAVVFVVMLGYVLDYHHLYGTYSVTYDSNLTLLGKVMEYNMVSDPVPAQDQGVQSDVEDTINKGFHDPWNVAAVHLEKSYWNQGYAQYGPFDRYIILHNLGTYIQKTLPDIYSAWQAGGIFYPFYGTDSNNQVVQSPGTVTGFNGYQLVSGVVASGSAEPFWINGLLVLSSFEQSSYWLLPLLLLLFAVRLWRRPQESENWTLVAMLLAIVSVIIIAASLNYSEWYRIRYPIDWAMIGISVIVLFELVFPAKAVTVATNDATSVAAKRLRLEDIDESTMKRAIVPRSQPLVDVSPVTATVSPVEISFVLPCLNEEEAIGGCIDTIKDVIAQHHLSAEILVVDNASTDRSAAIALDHGARVVYQPLRGYGNAYLKGFAEARGKYIVMADADNTYDFNEIETFIQPLRDGYDLVMGNRFAGRMSKGAMTWSHRYIGNPILSGMLNLFFHPGIRDAHCGMRSFTKVAVERMRLQTGGMEFASEMVINAAKAGLKITERPIGYHPRIGESKLHTFRDGWRHLRFMLLYSPTNLFLIPGVLIMVIGIVVEGLLLPGPFPLFGHNWDVHTMLLASVVTTIGLQIISLGLFARFFSLTEDLDGEQDRLLNLIDKAFTLERGLQVGGAILFIGVIIGGWIFFNWAQAGFGTLSLIRPTIFASMLVAIGTQVIFNSFFLSYLQFRKSIGMNSQRR